MDLLSHPFVETILCDFIMTVIMPGVHMSHHHSSDIAFHVSNFKTHQALLWSWPPASNSSNLISVLCE